MLITNLHEIPNQKIEILEMVEGSVVKSKNFLKDFGAGLKNVVGGEIKSYTEMMEEARKIAKQRMVEKAESINADAIVAVYYTSSSVMSSASEMLAYGTAVRYVD